MEAVQRLLPVCRPSSCLSQSRTDNHLKTIYLEQLSPECKAYNGCLLKQSSLRTQKTPEKCQSTLKTLLFRPRSTAKSADRQEYVYLSVCALA